MKKAFLLFISTSFILGCSSAPTVAERESYSSFSGGQSAGDTTSFYWLTQRLSLPYSSSDYVVYGDYGWHQSDYRWRDNTVREIAREGMRHQSMQGLVSYSLHLRFNQEGEAVYQQYRLDGKVLPLTPQQIIQLRDEAQSVDSVTKKQNRQGLSLIQGYWDGKDFKSCDGRKYKQLEFNQTLPSFIVDRLSSIDNYVAFIGSSFSDKVTVTDLLMLKDDDFDCIERPELIGNE